MYLAGISVRRVKDITEALWGPSTVSNLNKKIDLPFRRPLSALRRSDAITGNTESH